MFKEFKEFAMRGNEKITTKARKRITTENTEGTEEENSVYSVSSVVKNNLAPQPPKSVYSATQPYRLKQLDAQIAHRS